jgi:hypothetical protein
MENGDKEKEAYIAAMLMVIIVVAAFATIVISR